MKDVARIAKERQQMNEIIRAFFVSRGYTEVEVPVLVQSPGMEPDLVPFETSVLTAAGVRIKASLITSPEYSMKKLLGNGMQKIFTITKAFRNAEHFGGEHNPEFSMLEWYQQGADYQACMDETAELVREVCAAFGRDILVPEKVRVRDLFLDLAGIDLNVAKKDDLIERCREVGVHVDEQDSESDLFYRLFLTQVEPHLNKKTIFLYDYPVYQAALAALTSDARFGQRFELYVNGLEICNGFTELTDPAEQKARFLEEAAVRRLQGKTVFPIDEKLLELLPSLANPTFGNALGIDRLHMLATGQTSIEDVLLFSAKELFQNSTTPPLHHLTT